MAKIKSASNIDVSDNITIIYNKNKSYRITIKFLLNLLKKAKQLKDAPILMLTFDKDKKEIIEMECKIRIKKKRY